MSMKKNSKILISAIAVYLLLLWILYAQESSAGNASFSSFGDAVWYSLITITTVGYGDVTPVTAVGKLIGVLFALCSIGILTALIGIGLRLIGSQIIPQLRLLRRRRRPWYIFNDANEDSSALADAIRQKNPNSVIIFLSDRATSLISDAVRLSVPYEKLLNRLAGQKDVSLFFMGEDPWQNYSQSLYAAERGFSVYCMTDSDADEAPQSLHLFALPDALSRCYWQTHPLKKTESLVVLIGCGRYGSALLERALLTNVFEAGRNTVYHVFGDSLHFQTTHSVLVEALTTESSGGDHLVFHREDWSENRALILQADRIILCTDFDEENLRLYATLKKWYVLQGTLHVRLGETIPGILSFGGREEILTPEFVIKDAVNRRAVLMNDLYNAGADDPTPWNELSAFHKQSNIAAADHLMVKVRYLLDDDSLTELTGETCRQAYARYRELYAEKEALFQEMEHRRWVRFSQMFNWQYAPVRDNSLRLHPLLIPFEQLPADEKKKDDFAWEMLGKLDL